MLAGTFKTFWQRPVRSAVPTLFGSSTVVNQVSSVRGMRLFNSLPSKEVGRDWGFIFGMLSMSASAASMLVFLGCYINNAKDGAMGNREEEMDKYVKHFIESKYCPVK